MKIPNSVAFSVGGMQIYWYGILLVAGMILLLLLTKAEAKRKMLPADTALDLCLVAIPCGVVGARLWYVAMFWQQFAVGVSNVLHVWDGGLSVYGAVVFALIGIAVYALKKKLPFLRLLDAVVPGLTLAQAIAVWGDFFNQTGYGPLVMQKSMQWFPLAVLIEQSDTVHFALFFYEFLWLALLFLLLWLVVRKRARHDGTALGLYLVFFAVGHGVCDLFKSDSIYLYGGLHTVSAVCAALLVVGVVLLLWKRAEIPAAPAEETPETSRALANEHEPDETVVDPVEQAQECAETILDTNDAASGADASEKED